MEIDDVAVRGCRDLHHVVFESVRDAVATADGGLRAVDGDPAEIAAAVTDLRSCPKFRAAPLFSGLAVERPGGKGEVQVILEGWVEDDVDAGGVEGERIVVPGLGCRPDLPVDRVIDRDPMDRRGEGR